MCDPETRLSGTNAVLRCPTASSTIPTISKKSKEEEAAAHKDYIQIIEDNSIVIYSDASKTKDGDGI
ncbi:hypothetical protein COCCADRAFT_105722, partial [Bipolaris zeicola 26-R-13]